MAGWIFVCSMNTEGECFIRRLFGDRNRVKNTKRGDTLFLYNKDTDVLWGPFLAETDLTRDIEPNAWCGCFPYQVRVSWSWNNLYKLENARNQLNQAGLQINYGKSYSGDEVERIKDVLRNRGKKIEIAHSILNKIKRINDLDKEIHALAHRIEEEWMRIKKHPADKYLDLCELNCKFCQKMRDFVWAMRDLNRELNIFRLNESDKS